MASPNRNERITASNTHTSKSSSTEEAPCAETNNHIHRKQQKLTALKSNQARLKRLEAFVSKNKLSIADITFLASDMSPRTYYRLGGKILVDAPPPEPLKQFCDISNLLLVHKIKSPKIYDFDYENGFALIEDFGNQTLTQLLKVTPNYEWAHYQNATEILCKIRGAIQQQPAFISSLTIDKLVEETNLYWQFYLKYKGVSFHESQITQWHLNWRDAFLKALNLCPHGLILRDYHVDNIMLTENGDYGVLDFQDAIWGPCVFDVVSLTEDARREVSTDIEDRVWDSFLQDVPKHQHQNYRLCGDILSAGRHAKILGVFTRYAINQDNHSKLQFIPHVEKLFRRSLIRAGLHNICGLIAEY